MMTDEQFLGYCEIHCRTERALFAGAQVNRLNELADFEPDPILHTKLYNSGWYTMRASYAQPRIDAARRRMHEAEVRKRNESVLARGFVEGDFFG